MPRSNVAAAQARGALTHHRNLFDSHARIAEFLTSDELEVVAFGYPSPVLKRLGERDIVDELRVIISDREQTSAYFTFSSQMRPSLHHCDRSTAERPEDERARVSDRRRRGPARNLGVRNLHGTLDRVGEPAEAAAEDDADPRPDGASRLQRRYRLAELAQADPSARL